MLPSPAPEVTLGDAIAEIAAQDGGGIQAAALLADLAERNHRHTESMFQSLYEAEKADHERTTRRLGEALDRLDKIYSRVAWLLGNDDPWEQP
jgi:hypothetical protein